MIVCQFWQQVFEGTSALPLPCIETTHLCCWEHELFGTSWKEEMQHAVSCYPRGSKASLMLKKSCTTSDSNTKVLQLTWLS